MMNASFDDLRREVAPNARTVPAASIMRGSLMGGGLVGGSLMGSGGASMTHALRGPATVPDHKQELDVYFHGPGAASAAGIGTLDPKLVAMACKGKRDFILFEDLDNAVNDGRRLVIVMPMGTSQRDIQRAQVYLASSLARWLSEQKTDGAGRPYGECKDEDPTLRKFFTRAQINSIRRFGELDQA